MRFRLLMGVAGALLAVCVVITVAAVVVRDRPTGPVRQRTGRSVSDTVVRFEPQARVPAPGGWRVVDVPADAAAYAGWLEAAADGLAEQVRTLPPDPAHVHVIVHEHVGCDLVGAPTLLVDTTFFVRYGTRTRSGGECYAPVEAFTVFRVARSDLSAVRVPLPVVDAPGELVAYVPDVGTARIIATDVSERARLEGLLADLREAGVPVDADRVRADVAARLKPPPARPMRAAAVPVTGCPGAEPVLDIRRQGVTAAPRHPCPAATTTGVAVFILPEETVPDGVLG